MNSGDKIILELEISRIADKIINVAQKDENGIYWYGHNYDDSLDTFDRKIFTDLYSGGAGIALFFIELYKKYPTEKYFNVIKDSLGWLEKNHVYDPVISPSFYSGNLGIVYAMLKAYEVTKEYSYVKKALSLVKLSLINKQKYYWGNDFINGSAGTLLALLYIYSVTKKGWILTELNDIVIRLIEDCGLGLKGLGWGSSYNMIRDLTGFSHGAAGIGFTFLELGKYFNNKSLYWLAEQSFTYENAMYDHLNQNWKDLRKPLLKAEYDIHKDNYLQNKYSYLDNWNNMNAWCHGAVGIGFARIRAYELTGNKIYKRDIIRAVRKTIKTDCGISSWRNFCLCHGGAGNADFLIEASLILKDKNLKNTYEEIALNGTKFFNENKSYVTIPRPEEYGLMDGLAGIGYFYLRVLYPDIPSVLFPKIDKIISPNTKLTQLSNLNISEADIKEILINKSFPRTLFIAKSILQTGEINQFFCAKSNRKENQLTEFIKFIKINIKKLDGKEKFLLKDALSLERSKLLMNEKYHNKAILFIKNYTKETRASTSLSMGEAILSEKIFVINPDLRMIRTKWNWKADTFKGNIRTEPGLYHFLLIPTYIGIKETKLSDFNALLVKYFNKPSNVLDFIYHARKYFKIEPGEEEKVKNWLLLQVNDNIKSEILINII